MHIFDELKNSEIQYLIDEHIHSQRDREIMKYKLIDNRTAEWIADKIDKLTHTMKSIKTTIAMAEAEERDGESGYYPYMGSYRSYGDGNSMRRGGRSNARRRDSMGRYSRENRGYSRADAKADMVDDLRELMEDAPDERTRMRFKEFIREIENV